MATPKKATKAPEQPQAQTFDWSNTGSTGFENVHREDLGIPFLVVLQKGNPEVDKAHPNHKEKRIEGAEAGDVINTLSREIIHKYGNDPISFVPCGFEKLYMEWKPRESGGGLVKAHRDPQILNECQRNEKNQDVLRNGNLIVTTAYFYGLHLNGEDRVQCVIGMSSTQQKKSRQWLNMMAAIKLNGPRGKFTPPMYSHKYLLSTESESNTKGSWFGWKISCAGVINDPALIADAIESSKRVTAQQRTALPPPPPEDGETSSPPFA